MRAILVDSDLENVIKAWPTLYPQGGEYLAASTNYRSRVAAELERLDCVRVTQEGDDGINVVFHDSEFERVAEVMKPRKRRTLSEEHATSLTTAGIAALARYRNSNGAGTERRRDASTSVDSPAA